MSYRFVERAVLALVVVAFALVFGNYVVSKVEAVAATASASLNP